MANFATDCRGMPKTTYQNHALQYNLLYTVDQVFLDRRGENIWA